MSGYYHPVLGIKGVSATYQTDDYIEWDTSDYSNHGGHFIVAPGNDVTLIQVPAPGWYEAVVAAEGLLVFGGNAAYLRLQAASSRLADSTWGIATAHIFWCGPITNPTNQRLRVQHRALSAGSLPSDLFDISMTVRLLHWIV